MVRVEPTPLPGAYELVPRIAKDPRGLFVKTLQAATLAAAGIDFTLREEFYSTSAEGVLRGMHFQTPPHEHDKIVHCLEGAILDVIVDLRSESPTYGRWHSVELNAENRLGLFVPRGLAHGFLALRDHSLVMYKTSSEHAPKSDRGILWNSFGFAWPVPDPLLSERDRAHPALADFHSPF